MKILLAYLSGISNRNDPYISLVPTGLCYLHACLREAGHDSILANFSGWSVLRIEAELQNIKPDLIGISQWTHNRHASRQLADKCRTLFPDCTIVMGGGHATFCYEELLKEGSPVDLVIRGEAEQTLLELVERINRHDAWHDLDGIAFRSEGTVVTTRDRTPLPDLDLLPLPSRYFDCSIGINRELQPEFIVTARGCPSACHFCSSPAFWGRKVRFRSPRAIIDEILYLRRTFGLIYFSIRDDTFTADRQRTVEFCSMLLEQRVNILWNCQSRVTALDEELLIMMKRAGCECIQLGVESGSPRILRQLNKNIDPARIEAACTMIRTVGINLSIYLISDVPGETSQDLQQTIDLIQRIQPDDGYVSPLAYYPGTRLFNDAISSGNADRAMFNETDTYALYAMKNHGKSSKRLLKELSKKPPADPSRFERQKKLLGFCFTTNVLAGECYRHNGKFTAAEREFLEITHLQPGNPWGWFLLGELYAETGRIKKGRICYGRVLEIVPEHGPSKAALQ